ncbi:MAG: universal stress protein [Bacteroidetes bacterium]|nr:MAG: universal stress protein [Bacteroidota bacterium]
MQNILVAIDFGDTTDRLMQVATTHAQQFGAKLWLVHVAAPDPDFVGYEAGPQAEREFRALTLRKEHRDLQRLAQRFAGDGLSTEALLVQGPTTRTLMQQAKKLEADLIVIGSHGHGRLYDAVVGSVCAEMIHQSTIPLLVVPVWEGKR